MDKTLSAEPLGSAPVSLCRTASKPEFCSLNTVWHFACNVALVPAKAFV